MRYALGLMSGTSCDGVSLALCSFKGQCLKIHAHGNFPYPPAIQKKLLGALHLKTSALSKLNTELGIYFAHCAERFLENSKIKKSAVAVIGSHGHTVYHGPTDKPKNTFQIGEPSFLAEQIGAAVVSDFRPRDIAAGGQGPPLVPFFDHYYFGKRKNLALQNIGGIGNVTFLSNSGGVLAFDTGPGNCLIDLAVQQMTRGKKLFDAGGKIARRGWLDAKAIQKMIRHPFFKQKPPKSTGRELFNSDWLGRYTKHLKPEDRVATLTFFTAYSIFESYRRFLPGVKKIIVSGGGSKNHTLMAYLTKLFHPIAVNTIESLGVPTQAKEPAAFAFFAWQAVHGKINHAPQGTGARQACILGKITWS